MGISLKGHDSNFQYWVFDIDGRDWIAVNQSTQTPLKIQFQGRYGNWGTGNPLSKAAGFDIISSTVSKVGPDGEKQGVVEWVWNGTRYKSAWGLYPGTEIIAGDLAEGIEAIWDYQLAFTTGIPYDGPAGGAVGTGVTSQAVIEAAATQITPSAQLSTAAPEQASPKPVATGIASNAVIQAQQAGGAVVNSSAAVEETQDALAAANKALAYSEAQGTVNIQALNTARIELKNAKDTLAAAEAKSTQNQAVLMSQLREQLDAIQERTDIQVKIYQQMVLQAQKAAQTPPVGGTTPIGITSPVVISKPADNQTVVPAAVAGVDWPGLVIKLGAAYLLLS
jgi:hypothetical protein